MSEQAQSRGRTLTGRIVSDAMDKTVVVEVTRRVKHRRYKKYINRTSRYSAHDENNGFAVNEVVLIRESRPLSKTKRWRVVGKANG